MTESPVGPPLAGAASANPVVADEPEQITGAQSLVRALEHVNLPRREIHFDY